MICQKSMFLFCHIVSLLRSYLNRPESRNIRPVNRIEQRIGEAEKLGFKRFILHKYNMQGLNTKKIKMELIPVRKVEEAFRALFG